MAYSDFKTLDKVTKSFQLEIEESGDLFADVPESAPSVLLQTLLDKQTPLALSIATEKARSELIIAPILVELWSLKHQQISLFSGVEFDVEPQQGLTGVCDYIISQSKEQLFIRAPVLMLVEAKNEDMKRGYAQCIAEMVAAQSFNVREGNPQKTVSGVVTTGNIWKFLRLEEKTVWIDRRDYYIEHIGKILGILQYLVSQVELT